MPTLTVSVSEEVRDWVEAEAEANFIHDPAEFVDQLLCEARSRSEAEREKNLERLLLEGLDSGPPEPMDANWWARVRAEVDARQQKRSAAAQTSRGA